MPLHDKNINLLGGSPSRQKITEESVAEASPRYSQPQEQKIAKPSKPGWFKKLFSRKEKDKPAAPPQPAKDDIFLNKINLKPEKINKGKLLGAVRPGLSN